MVVTHAAFEISVVMILRRASRVSGYLRHYPRDRRAGSPDRLVRCREAVAPVAPRRGRLLFLIPSCALAEAAVQVLDRRLQRAEKGAPIGPGQALQHALLEFGDGLFARDQEADAQMDRNKNRPLPKGELSSTNVITFALILGIISMAFVKSELASFIFPNT